MSAVLARAATRLVAASLALGAVVTAPSATAAPPQPTPGAGGSSSTADPATGNANKATFGIGPANAKGIDGRANLDFLTTPGAKLTDRIALVNIAAKPVTLNLYAVDTALGSDGSLGYQPRAAKRVDAGNWIVPELPGGASTVTLGPQQTKVVPLSISVPANASPGDHAAGVIASVISKVISDKSPQGVDFEQRVALRAFFRVSGALRPELSVQGLTVRWKGTLDPFGGGTATVDYTVRNTGNVRLGAKQQVSVSGLFGSTSPKKPVAAIPLLFPGNAVHVAVAVPGVFPQFAMHARVLLYPLTVSGDVDPGLPPNIAAAKSFWAVPWTLIALVVALVLVIGGLWWRRRHVRRHRGPSGGRHRGNRGPQPGPNGGPHSHRRTVAGVASMVVAVLGLGAATAHADVAVPYTDYAVSGSVGLCDAAGHPVTSGNINDRPFVYRAVSSVAAVHGYDSAGRKATLLAYQPRQNANPNLWSGDTLTSSSTYTNPRYPMAQATSVDFSLKDFLAEYPPLWNGLVQLRMYLGAPQQGTYSDSYPATDIQIAGDTWQVVRGASVPCTDGSAKDGETHFVAPTSGASHSAAVKNGASSHAATHQAAGGTSSTPTDSASGSAAVSDVAGAKHSSGKGSSTGAVIAAVVAAVIVAALSGLLLWRRRARIG